MPLDPEMVVKQLTAVIEPVVDAREGNQQEIWLRVPPDEATFLCTRLAGGD
jgi:hypothetical protein